MSSLVFSPVGRVLGGGAALASFGYGACQIGIGILSLSAIRTLGAHWNKYKAEDRKVQALVGNILVAVGAFIFGPTELYTGSLIGKAVVVGFFTEASLSAVQGAVIWLVAGLGLQTIGFFGFLGGTAMPNAFAAITFRCMHGRWK